MKDGSVDKASKKGTMCGVQVITWGSHDTPFGEPQNEGNDAFLIQPNLAGSNVGHAAMLVRIPDTPENRRLINDTLNANGEKSKIPVTYRSYATPSLIGFDEQRNPIYGDKPVYEEKVIEVYFSWWPGKEGYAFNTLEQDTISERPGVHTNYEPKWVEAIGLKPEERKVSTGLKSRIVDHAITLGPTAIGQLRGYSQVEQQVLTQYQNLLILQSEYSAINLLISKLNKQNDKNEITLDITEALLLKRFLTFEHKDNKIRPNEVLPMLVSKQQIIYRDIARAKIDYVGSLIELNGKAQLLDIYRMGHAEKQDYEMIEKLRRFIEIGEKYDPKTQVNLHILNKLYKEIFSGSHDIDTSVLSVLISQAKADPLLNSGAALKGDFNSLLTHASNIENLKDLSIKLNIYQEAKQIKHADVNQLRAEFINALIRNEQFANAFMDNGTFDDKYLESLTERIDEALDPMSGKDYVQFIKIVDHTDFIKELSEEKAQRLINDSITHGHAPDHTVNLPIQTATLPGLDVQLMLRTMADIEKQGRTFQLFTNNCADNCCQVLAAGAGNQAHLFQRKTFNQTMINPQMAYNNALAYSASFLNHIPQEQRSYYMAVTKYLTELVLHYNEKVDDKNNRAVNAAYIAATIAAAIPAGILSTPGLMIDAAQRLTRRTGEMVFSPRTSPPLSELATKSADAPATKADIKDKNPTSADTQTVKPIKNK